MKIDITREVETCQVCHISYCPNDGEICQCPEEPVVSDWEDFALNQLDTENATAQ